MERGGILQQLRGAGLTLALFALAFRALLPPGFMLAPDAHGALAVALCSVDGPSEILIDARTGEPIEDAPAERRDMGAVCVFAAAPPLSCAPVAVATPAPRSAVAYAIAWSALTTTAYVGLAAEPPWPTGPPTSI